MSRTIYLLTGDETSHRVIVSSDDVKDMILIQTMLADDDDDTEIPEIPLLEVTKDVLDIVLEWVRHHHGNPYIPIPSDKDHLPGLLIPDQQFDQDFFNKLILPGTHAIFDRVHRVAQACSYLDLPDLINLFKYCEAHYLIDKDQKTVDDLLGILIPLAPEQERKLREDNMWIFDHCKHV